VLTRSDLIKEEARSKSLTFRWHIGICIPTFESDKTSESWPTQILLDEALWPSAACSTKVQDGRDLRSFELQYSQKDVQADSARQSIPQDFGGETMPIEMKHDAWHSLGGFHERIEDALNKHGKVSSYTFQHRFILAFHQEVSHDEDSGVLPILIMI
jgi:hypothetical protein